MSKTGELSQAIEELRHCGNTLLGIADALTALFSGSESTTAAETPPVPKPLSLEEVRAVLADISRSGKTAEVRELLQKHGADKLSAIDPANYAALLADATRVGLTEGLT